MEKPSLIGKIGLFLGITAIALVGGLLIPAFITNFFVYPRILDLRFPNYDSQTREVIVKELFRDGHTEILETFTATTDQPSNPLLDPLYAGRAPVATGYNPVALYEKVPESHYFTYNRGRNYGDWGILEFNEETGIMTVKFHNGVVSYVDAEGVIASVKVSDGDEATLVAFYDRNC